MRSYHTPKSPSQRQLKVGEEIRHLLSDVLRRSDFHHGVLTKTSVNVTEVRMSPDLRHARVYVLSLQGENMAEVVTALNELTSKIRHLLSKRLTLKFLPQLKFVEDLTFFQAAKIDALLQSTHVAQDLASKRYQSKTNKS
jgi:ribosome-binding factor A